LRDIPTASLDRTFPARLLNEPIPNNVTEKGIRAKYEEQKAYRSRLMNAGLVQAEDLVDLPADRSLDAADTRVLWHYLSDSEKKFRAYSGLLEKIELFLEVIRTKNFIRKRLEVDRERGF